MKNLIASLIVLMAASAYAADITIDAKVTGNVVVLSAKTEGKIVVWIVPDTLTQPVPSDAFKDTKTCVIQGKPGTYKVTAISAIPDPAKKDDAKPIFGDTTFKLSGDAPQPDIPPGPLPVDDLPAKLKAAYVAETSLAKRGQLVNIIAIYSAMADAANDKDIVTSQQLFDVLAKVKAGMLIDGVLMEMRRLATVEVAACVGPVGPAPFDRAKVSACFKRIVKSMPTPE